MPLDANQYRINRLAPGVLSDQAVFHIDQSTVVRIEITANSGSINTSILTPTGQVINANTVASFGGSFQSFDVTGQSGPALLPTLTTGFHFVYIFQNQLAGDYTVRFQAASTPSDEIAIFTEVTTDSKVAATLFTTDPVIILGNPVVLSAAIFNDKTPIAGATAAVVLKPPAGATVNLSLLDDGGPADGAAADGLYSGEFTPTATGKYTALAKITGTIGGITFSRQAMTAFTVVAQPATLTGSVSDRGVDDNSNGLFDRVVVTAGVNVTQAGKHRLFVQLKTPSGATLVRSTDQNLVLGIQNIDVSFEASAFTALGENGPYTIVSIELDSIGSNGAAPSDRAFNVGSTKPYLLSQFEQSALSFVGVTSTQGEDTNGNGLFDKLVVQVQVKALVAGSYSWSLKLDDQSRGEIDFTSGSGSLSAGLNTLRLEFKGSAIGGSGIDGPYLLRDLLLFSSSASLVQSDSGQTQAFRANQFEGFNPNIANLAITEAASPNPVVSGGALTYTLTLTNNGPRNAPSVTVSDNLPSSVTFVSCLATGGGVCGGNGNNRTVTFVPLTAGASATITMLTSVNNGVTSPSITNTSTVTSTASDPDSSNNTATATVQTAKIVQFGSASYTVTEGQPRIDITLSRSGDITSSATVRFATNDNAGLTNCNVFNGIASPRCDYTNTVSTMTFAAGESSKSFSVGIVDDAYAEGTETFTIGLNSPSGASLGAQSTATVTITDNETVNGTNPIDSTNFFVRQQYLDFLGREPDPPGLAGWANTINNCSGDTTQCDRIHVSQLFFQSAEFQDRGYFVYKFYPVAFGRKPDYGEFVPDLASVSGFLDANQLEAAKVAFIVAFMARTAFVNTYNVLTNQQYVDALLNTAGVTLSSRQTMINGLNASTMTRAQVLRQIVESTEVSTKYNHQAYAVMEYFGYLRRQPDGFYLQWIQVLDSTNDPRGMVTGFVTSAEYRQRFGP